MATSANQIEKRIAEQNKRWLERKEPVKKVKKYNRFRKFEFGRKKECFEGLT